MKALILTLLILSSVTLSNSHNWISIGPDTVAVNNAFTSSNADVLLISDGILISQGDKWLKHSNSLPAWDIIELDPDTLIIVMGNEGRSDGIYRFTISDSKFQIVGGSVNPHFIVRNPVNNFYYVGGIWGLVKSINGIEWEEVEFFKNKNCVAMDFFNEYCVVSVAGDTSGIYYSDDGGDSWFSSSDMSHYLADLVFDNNGLLYGIYPGESKSAGLWKSKTYGANWDVEFWSVNMSSLGYTANNLYVSWHKSDCNQTGVAIWDVLNQNLIFLNDGLPNTNIRNIAEDQFFDCPNITACTESGAYCLTEFPVGIEDENTIPRNFNLLQNYPNPFNPTTVISYQLAVNSQVELTVYNLLGQKVATLFKGRQKAGSYYYQWNAGNLPSGVYLYRLVTDKGLALTKKMILLK